MAPCMMRAWMMVCMISSQVMVVEATEDSESSEASASTEASEVKFCDIKLDTKFKQGDGKLTVEGDIGQINPNKKIGNGTFRIGYKGMVGRQAVIVKIFVKVDKKHAKAADWRKDVDESVKAQKYANEFGAKVNKVFTFAVPKVFKVIGRCDNDEFRAGDRVLVEPMLEGDFKKWNNNARYKWKDAPGQGNGAIVQSFSHWTYHKSGGKEMVLDLQGTRYKGKKYTFTDPAIVTLKKTGGSDRGEKAMNEFFESYNKYWPCKRNPFCKKLKIKDWLTPHKKEGGVGRSTRTETDDDDDDETSIVKKPSSRKGKGKEDL